MVKAGIAEQLAFTQPALRSGNSISPDHLAAVRASNSCLRPGQAQTSMAALSRTSCNAASYFEGTQPLAHSRVSRHLVWKAHSAASLVQCRAAQVLLGGKPGQWTRMHSMTDEKCRASSVFAMGSVQCSSHMIPFRHVDEKRHLAKVEVQLPRTQSGLGFKEDGSMGQLLTQPSVSSTVLLSIKLALRIMAWRSMVCVGFCAWATTRSEKALRTQVMATVERRRGCL